MATLPTYAASQVLASTPLSGLSRDLQTAFLDDGISVLKFGVANVGHDVVTRLSSLGITLAEAQARYGSHVTSLNDMQDWAGLQAAVNYCLANKKRLNLHSARLNIDKFVLINDQHQIYGQGAVIGLQDQATGRINDGTTPSLDLTYPTATSPGPMAGCAFYIPDTVYYGVIDGIKFIDGRFAICQNRDANSPTYRNLTFDYCNAGVFHYQGCQNPLYENCGGVQLGVLHISSCTAFPSDSPYRDLDNYYSDDVKFVNARTGFNSCGLVTWSAFDTWFIGSILRPNTDSYTVNGAVRKYTTTDSSGVVITDPFWLNVTGSMGTMFYRTIRQQTGFTAIGVDTRGSQPYPFFRIGTEIRQLLLSGFKYEGMYSALPDTDTRPVLLACGAVKAGNLADLSQVSYIDNLHEPISYNGRGISEGTADGSSFEITGSTVIRSATSELRGHVLDTFWKKKEAINIRENQQLRTQGRPDVNAPADFQIFMDDCSVLDSFDKRLILRTTPRVFDLPFKGSDGILRGSAMLSWITHFCGFIRITVRNRTTGVIDYAIYRVSSDQAETITLANSLSNDDTQVVTTTPLSQGVNTPRFSYYFPVQADGVTPITGTNAGKGFMVDEYVGGNTSLIGSRMSGLSAAYAVGAKFHRVQVLAPVKAFATSMASLTYNAGGGLPFQGANQIGIKNGAGASTVAEAKLLDNLQVSFFLSHFPDICA